MRCPTNSKSSGRTFDADYTATDHPSVHQAVLVGGLVLEVSSGHEYLFRRNKPWERIHAEYSGNARHETQARTTAPLVRHRAIIAGGEKPLGYAISRTHGVNAPSGTAPARSQRIQTGGRGGPSIPHQGTVRRGSREPDAHVKIELLPGRAIRQEPPTSMTGSADCASSNPQYIQRRDPFDPNPRCQRRTSVRRSSCSLGMEQPAR